MPDEEIEMHNKNHSHFQHYSCDPPSAKSAKTLAGKIQGIERNAVCSFVIFLSVNGYCLKKLKRKDTEDTLSPSLCNR